MGYTVLVSNFRRYFKLASYVSTFTDRSIVIAMGIPSLKVGPYAHQHADSSSLECAHAQQCCKHLWLQRVHSFRLQHAAMCRNFSTSGTMQTWKAGFWRVRRDFATPSSYVHETPSDICLCGCFRFRAIAEVRSEGEQSLLPPTCFICL